MCQVVSVVSDFVTLWPISLQAPLSMGFPRQECWGGLPCPPPGDLANPEVEPRSLAAPALGGGFFTTSATGNVHLYSWPEAPRTGLSPLLGHILSLHHSSLTVWFSFSQLHPPQNLPQRHPVQRLPQPWVGVRGGEGGREGAVPFFEGSVIKSILF